MSANAAQTRATQLSLQSFADLLEVSKINETLDLGSALIYKVTHPQRGDMILVNTAEGACGQMAC